MTLVTTTLPLAAWDSFWKYDRLSSFNAMPGAPNYAAPVADGWRTFFGSLDDGARVLDLATGNGAIAVIAVECGLAAGKTFTVSGADLADVCPTNFVTRNLAELAQVTFFPKTACERLPLANGCIDAAVSQYGIEYSDLTRSIPEAVRVLAPGGRLRFAIHAAEGVVARDTVSSIADADFLVALGIIGLATNCGTALAAFNAGLRAIADRVPTATDRAMLANVHRTLCDTYDYRRGDLVATAIHLHGEITAHRDRQSALLAAACSARQMTEIGARLEALGLAAIAYDHQRDRAGIIAHTIEARLS